MQEAVSGRKSREYLKRSARLGLLVKTHLQSEFAELTACCPTWSESVTPAGRAWCLLTLPGFDITVSDAGLWPTPVASDCNGYKCSKNYRNRQVKGGGTVRLNHWLFLAGREDLAHSPMFRATMMGWPEDYYRSLERLCCEWSETHGASRTRS